MVPVMNRWKWAVALVAVALLVTFVVLANRGDQQPVTPSDLPSATGSSASTSTGHVHTHPDGQVAHDPVTDPADPDDEFADRDEHDHDVQVDEETQKAYVKAATATVTAYSTQINEHKKGWLERIEPYATGDLHEGLKYTDTDNLVDRGEIATIEPAAYELGWVALVVTYEDDSQVLFGVTMDEPDWRVATTEPVPATS